MRPILACARVAPGSPAVDARTAAAATITVMGGQASSTGRIVVLAYHAIADLSHDRVLSEYAVSPARFAEQLDTLIDRGWSFVDLETVLAVLDGSHPPPRRGVLVTFDDGYADLLTAACPLLSERGIPALAFAVAGLIGGTNTWDREKGAGALRLLDDAGLRAATSHGVEIGSHAATHRALPSVPRDELDEELTGAAKQLEALGLPRPRSFSYPYGQWTPELAAAVRHAGYAAAFIGPPGVVGPNSNRFALPRIDVHASDTPRKLLLKMATAAWPGALRDPLLWLRGVRLEPSAQ